MLNRGVLNIDGSGGISAADVGGVATLDFNGGTPTKSNKSLVTSTVAPTRTLGGLGYTDAGALCIANNGTAVVWQAGIPLNASGQVCTATDKPATQFIAGLPFNTDGRLFISATPG